MITVKTVTSVTLSLVVLASTANANDTAHTALHRAAAGGAAEEVAALLAAGADLNARNQHQKTPLHYAATRSRAGPALALLAAGADPNARDEDRITPLHLTAMRGGPSTAAVLLLAGADPNASRAFRGETETPLQSAKRVGNSDVISVLQKRASAIRFAEAAMLQSAGTGAAEGVIWLLAAGVDPNALGRDPSAPPLTRSPVRATPLHVAAASGSSETVGILLSADADPNARDDQGSTSAASRRGRRSCRVRRRAPRQRRRSQLYRPRARDPSGAGPNIRAPGRGRAALCRN